MIKRYKIKEEENLYILYIRNPRYLWGLYFFLPLFILSFCGYLLTLKNSSMLSFFTFVVTTLSGGFTIPLMVEPLYKYEKLFYSSEELHDYIAELKLVEKPNVYYLD
jgi:amino acid permease